MSIDNELQKVQKAMAAELTASEKRLTKANEALETAKAALKTAEVTQTEAQKEFDEISTKHTQFVQMFPVTTTPVAPKAPKDPKKKAPRGDMTLIEKMVNVMGDQSMTARQIEEALVASGLIISANNTRSYISSLLGTQTKKVKDASGNTLRDPRTKELVRAMVFKKVDRGLYQVNKVDPSSIMAELAAAGSSTAVETSEVLLVNTGKSPADALFASQGIDVDSLVSPNNSLS